MQGVDVHVRQKKIQNTKHVAAETSHDMLTVTRWKSGILHQRHLTSSRLFVGSVTKHLQYCYLLWLSSVYIPTHNIMLSVTSTCITLHKTITSARALLSSTCTLHHQYTALNTDYFILQVHKIELTSESFKFNLCVLNVTSVGGDKGRCAGKIQNLNPPT